MTAEEKKSVTLKKHEEGRLLKGHQWIFSNEIQSTHGSPAAGDIVAIHRHDGKHLGIGFYHPHSLIAVRFLSTEDEPVGFDFFKKRIVSAWELRKKLFPHSSTYRLVHGESDFLPGLIVDKYGEYCVLQTLSAGMDRRRDVICDALESLMSPKGIIERNESPLRQLDHLPQEKSILRGTFEPTIIDLEGIQFRVNLLDGQKTGLFLDQRMNRTLLKPFVTDMTVLDCFCNEGGFGLYAARYGASCVESVDVSSQSLANAEANAQLNGLSTIKYHTGDVFEYLKNQVSTEKKYGCVILDPPSFTKSKKNIATALKGYKEINTAALKLITPGGILATASCSHHIDKDAFQQTIQESAVKAGRKIQLLHFTGAAPDHPVLLSMPETNYLKFALVRVE